MCVVPTRSVSVRELLISRLAHVYTPIEMDRSHHVRNSSVSSPAAPTVFTMSLNLVTFMFPSQDFNAALVLTDSIGASVEDCGLALSAEDLGV